uniref:Endoribonuclease L-PSP/chorismate mutase-like domain-containing protein n=1 Tax=Attheya septentrionalis TaxID=420275 RepID=A0A7S2U7P2_9STRA|mmetsp:Transcript_11600/g.21116  ORF Transcript_11600/g.21116 Transcript_11600/m.21116 type:complete len:198 (+) Transcript_11600:46-639(+)
MMSSMRVGVQRLGLRMAATSQPQVVAMMASRHDTNSMTRRQVHVEKRLEELGVTLPKPAAPRANYNIVCRASGNMLYISGHLPFRVDDGTLMTGVVSDANIDEGYQAARLCGLGIISTLKEHLGDLDRVEQVVKIFGIVNSTTDFKSQHLVMDGCSDVIMEVFGKPVGYHARSAIGTNTLPLDMPVEVEAIVQIKPE